MRSTDCSIDKPFPVVPDDLAPLGVDPGMFQCVDRVLSLGRVHPSEKTVDEEVVLEGVFRALLAHRVRIAPLVIAVARLTLDSSPITRDSTSLQ